MAAIARPIAVALVFALMSSGLTAVQASAATPLPKPHPRKAKQMATAVPLPERRTGSVPAPAPSPRNPVAAPVTLTPPPAARPARPAQGARLAIAATRETPQADVAVLGEVVKQLKAESTQVATATAAGLRDPLALKVAEWLILRSTDNGAPAERYLAFIAANPAWPSVNFMHRRVEATLFDDNRDAGFMLDYFARRQPQTAKGYFAHARALLERGDRAGAARQVRAAWRTERMWRSLEETALREFGALLNPSDHKARMDLLFSYDDSEGGLRCAERIGGASLAVAKARAAVIRRASNAKKLLDAVPESARNEPGYLFSLAQWLRRNDHSAEAARAFAAVPKDAHIANRDDWWIERRVLVRQLLDAGNPRDAYRVARDAARPDKRVYQTDQEFTAGWIALRYLNDPNTALAHFSRIDGNTDNPTALGRAGYWQGRALEALGRRSEAQAAYAQGAAHTTTYYGQLARARIGIETLELRGPPPGAASRGANLEVVRALELLYAVGEKDLAVPLLVEVGEYGDVDAIAALAEVANRNRDARGLVLLANDAINRGLPFDHHAFPTFGLPKVRQIGPDIDPAVVYAIARQESRFDPTVVSPAKAMGLMQVTPAAAKYVSKKFGVAYHHDKLLSDQVYNVQLGSAELADLLKDYQGSYILTFVGYNAGRGRVRQWVERFGDPRDPKVDAVDWVERIPFSETRNYVQRILENLQIYRARLHGSKGLQIEADLNGGRGAQ